ncbi:MAG: tRNA (adenosine(37)-N6)-dimethylallyltransferase MiaA [Sphingobacteriaceae bacterium]
MSTLITLVGPTAIGKTDLAIKLAQELNTEIVSADSRQFFREMSIGTAKPSAEELKSAKHHFINSHSIQDSFSVGDFEKEGLKVIEQIFQKHSTAILVGGSGLYINAITQGFDNLPKAPAEIREKLNKQLADEGIEPLQQQLKALDPDYFTEVDIHNPQRLIRALEVCLSTGKTFSELRTHGEHSRPFKIIKIGLNTDRGLLYERINQRVDQMMDSGLLKEAERLFPYRGLNALQTVGYQELFDYFDGNCSLEEAIEKIKQNTRRFAKRQLTWFRRDEDMTWFEPQETRQIIDFINNELGKIA